MNRVFKKTLTLLLCVLVLFGVAIPGLFTFSASAKTIGEYALGELVNFGWYPQTKVTDSATINTLNNLSATWQSYGYYSGTGSYSDGNMVPSGYMEYTDIMLGGQKYRGVRFSQYRPYYTGLIPSVNTTFQDENSYNQPGTIYWFAWEQVDWRVLEPETGLVLCESIIDSQPYNNFVLKSGADAYGKTAYWGNADKTYYANNFAESSLRQWLNHNFYNTAFSSSQQEIIVPTTRANAAYSTSYSAYDSAPTTDKVSLLTFSDVTNTAYGFNAEDLDYDYARQAQGSDYAKCQGLYVDASNQSSRWWLRSAGYYSDHACSVDYDGVVGDYYSGSSNTNFGIRPALILNLTNEIVQSDVSEVGRTTAMRYLVPALSGTATTLIFKNGAEEYRVTADNGVFVKEDVPVAVYKVYALRKNSLTIYIGEHNSALDAFTNSDAITLPMGDVNGDGVIDIADLSVLMAAGNYGESNTDIDLDGDGRITIGDIAVAVQAQGYGKTSVAIV